MTAAPSGDRSTRRSKRRCSVIKKHAEGISPPSDGANLPEKPKRRFQARRRTTSAYWDSLSKIWLTEQALTELDRRNNNLARPLRATVPIGPNLDDEACPSKSRHIKRFAKHGGPDLRELPGYPEPTPQDPTANVIASNHLSARAQSKSEISGSSAEAAPNLNSSEPSPYDENFRQYLVQNRIFPDDHDLQEGRDPPRPNNEMQIRDRLRQPRRSLTHSHQWPEKAFRDFKRKDNGAHDANEVMIGVFPLLHGNDTIFTARNEAFKNLQPLPDGNLVNVQLDFFDGAATEQLGPQICEELARHIMPTTKGHMPVLPNFFASAKGPHGSSAVAELEALHAGALGARGIHKLRSYEADPTREDDNNAYTITSTYHAGQLKLYTMHPTKRSTGDDGSPAYHMTQLDSYAMTGSADKFREGASAFRNARDWAKERRDEVTAAAKARIGGTPAEMATVDSDTNIVSQSTAIEPVQQASETRENEHSQRSDEDFGSPHKRFRRDPKKSPSGSKPRACREKTSRGAKGRTRARARRSQRGR